MKDLDVQRILAEGFPIAAVLLNRAGWVSGSTVTIACRFEHEPERGLEALWMIDVHTQDNTQLHTIYLKAESIVGISVARSPRYDDQK